MASRGAIKVGSGYIEIEPRISREAMRAMRTDLLKQMGAAGTAAGREFSKAAGRGVSGLSRAAADAAKRTGRAVRQEATDTSQALRRVERDLTREYGDQAAQRFRHFRDRELQRRQLVEGTSEATRAALRRTAREEEDAARAAVRRTEMAERDRRRLIRDREREATRAEQSQTRAQVQAQRTAREELTRTVQAAQRARRADLEDQLRTTTAAAASMRGQLRDYQRQISDLQGASATSLGRLRSAWDTQAGSVELLGTRAVEAGRLVATHLVAPLGAVAAALTTIGVRSADSLILGQLGLMGAGVSAPDSAAALERVRQYGVETPYSIEAMQSYMTRYIRAIISHDPDHDSDDPALRDAAGNRAANRAVDIVQMIGDNAARSGNLDPAMVERAMYAVDMILDMDRVPTRNLRQFVNASGIPVQELALLLGYKDDEDNAASAQMLDAMANAAKTGGVQGQDFIEALLADWSAPDGARGFASRVGSSTIGGRLQQMKEATQVRLGGMFARQNPETGLYEYTGLGEAIMGRRVEGADGHVAFEGGLLNQVADIGTAALPHAQALLEEFFEVLGTFTSWARSTVEWLGEHEGLRDAILAFARIAALAAPFILGLGLLTKGVGRFARLLGSAVTPVAGLARGVRGGSRVARQVRAGVSSRRGGGTFGDGYRARRTELRGGDARGPVRRSVDGLTGRNSQVDAITRQVRDLEEQIRDADRRAADLRGELRDVNSTRLRDLVDALGGTGGTSVRGAAGQAQTAVRQVATDGVDVLDRAQLRQLRDELDDVADKADTLKRAVRDAGDQVKTLDGRRLGSLRDQQINPTERRASALERAVHAVNSEMRELDGRSLARVRNEFIQLTPKVSEARKKVADTSTAVANLNSRSLASIRGKFKGDATSLYNAVSDVHARVGTATGNGLSARITTLNGRKLGDLRGEVNRLKDALDAADDKADNLDGAIGRVNRATGRSGSTGGSSGGSNRHTERRARGGVLPGYQPGVDSIPALLSPGEAILRPEVAAHLGPETIDTWNALAIRGQLPRYASGSSFVRDSMAGVQRLFSLGEMVRLFGTTVGFAPTAADIGGSTGRGVSRWGIRAGGSTAGRGAATQMRGLLDWVTTGVPDLLRRTPSGLGQILGIIAGAVAPTAGQYFWDDVWKGEGNVAERGQRWVNHMLSPGALWQIVQDAVSGIVDTVKTVLSLVKGLVSDPKGMFDDALAEAREVLSGVVDGVTGTVSGLRDIMADPGEYAREVWDEFYAQAKDAMPNTTGLFAFAEGGIVPGYAPGDDRVPAVLSPGEAVLRPEAARALGYGYINGLNRAAQLGGVTTPSSAYRTAEQWPDRERAQSAPFEKRYEVHIHEARTETTAQAVLRAMQHAETLYGQ